MIDRLWIEQGLENFGQFHAKIFGTFCEKQNYCTPSAVPQNLPNFLQHSVTYCILVHMQSVSSQIRKKVALGVILRHDSH